MLTGLLARLRLPERVFDALEELRTIRIELTRVRKQTEPLEELLPALQNIEEALGNRLQSVHDELTQVREQTKPVDDLLPTLERLEEALGSRFDAVHEVVVALESEDSHLNRSTSKLATQVELIHDILAPINGRLAIVERSINELGHEVATINKNLLGVNDDIQRITGLRGERGIMERARDAITGGNKEEEMPLTEGERPNTRPSASATGEQPPT